MDGTVSNSPRAGSATHRSAAVLTEPMTVARFWKNRRGDAVCVSIESYEGRVVLHVRQYFTDKAGKFTPTKKGIALPILRLPELVAAINKAARVARELGLIPGSGAGHD